MARKPTTVRWTDDELALVAEAATRQGNSVAQFVRQAALMRARMASTDQPYPLRHLAAEMRRLGEAGAQMIEEAEWVAGLRVENNKD